MSSNFMWWHNHWELVRIIENQQESMRIRVWTYLRINENQFQTYLRIIENWQESLRISENHWELARIIKNQFQTDSKNQWESSRINFTLIWESVRITENWWESTRIIESHIKNKVLPLRWSKAKWHRYMKINVWFCESLSFSHSVKSTE